MSLIFVDENNKVYLIHNQPETLTAEERKNGIEVNEIPVHENIENKIPVLYRTPTTGDLYYEYVDRPLTPEEKMQQMEQKQELMQQAIDELIFGGAF